MKILKFAIIPISFLFLFFIIPRNSFSDVCVTQPQPVLVQITDLCGTINCIDERPPTWTTACASRDYDGDCEVTVNDALILIPKAPARVCGSVLSTNCEKQYGTGSTCIKSCPLGDDAVWLGECSEPVDTCPLKNQGDANCNNVIDDADYQIWKTEYMTGNSCAPGNKADFDNDGCSYLLDFEIWRSNRK